MRGKAVFYQQVKMLLKYLGICYYSDVVILPVRRASSRFWHTLGPVDNPTSVLSSIPASTELDLTHMPETEAVEEAVC